MNIFVREMTKRHQQRAKDKAEGKLAAIARSETPEEDKLTAWSAYLDMCGYDNDIRQAERARGIVWKRSTDLGERMH